MEATVSKIPTVNIDTKLYQNFKFLVKKEKSSVAKVIRELVESYTSKRLTNKKRNSFQLNKYIANSPKVGKENIASTDIDKFIY